MTHKQQVDNSKEDLKNYTQLIEKLIETAEAGAPVSQSEWKDLDAELADKYTRYNEVAKNLLDLLQNSPDKTKEWQEIEEFRTRVVVNQRHIQRKFTPTANSQAAPLVNIADVVAQAVTAALQNFQHQQAPQINFAGLSVELATALAGAGITN